MNDVRKATDGRVQPRSVEILGRVARSQAAKRALFGLADDAGRDRRDARRLERARIIALIAGLPLTKSERPGAEKILAAMARLR